MIQEHWVIPVLPAFWSRNSSIQPKGFWDFQWKVSKWPMVALEGARKTCLGTPSGSV